VHALVFQCVGRKRFFLASRDAVKDAVSRQRLPLSVLEKGNTEDHCVDGSLEEVFGLDDAAPRLVKGELAALEPGDCLVLPAGLYHDVASDGGPSMSLTVRFEVRDGATPEAGISIEDVAGNDKMKKFLMRLALKKAMRDGKAAALPARPQGTAV